MTWLPGAAAHYNARLCLAPDIAKSLGQETVVPTDCLTSAVHYTEMNM